MWDKRYRLAVRRLEDGDITSSVLAEFLGVLDSPDAEVKTVYLNRGLYDSKCLTLLQAHNYAYVLPIVRWGETIQQELAEGWSRVIDTDFDFRSSHMEIGMMSNKYIEKSNDERPRFKCVQSR